MSTYKIFGYATLLLSGVLLLVSVILYLEYAHENLMLNTLFCLSSVCISRADVFCPSLILGFVALVLALLLVWEDIGKFFNKITRPINI